MRGTHRFPDINENRERYEADGYFIRGRGPNSSCEPENKNSTRLGSNTVAIRNPRSYQDVTRPRAPNQICAKIRKNRCVYEELNCIFKEEATNKEIPRAWMIRSTNTVV